MPTLYVMSGMPGSGKTHYCKEHKNDGIHVSRDVIRFALLEDGDNYFAHENEVYEIFWEKINKELAAGNNVYADQTSLTMNARGWLLSHIKVPCKKVAIMMDTPLQTCLDRNDMRTGKERVPIKTMINMHQNFTKPRVDEGFDEIIVVYTP